MSYTAHRLEFVDRQIADDLERITARAVDLMPAHIHSVLLTGSFGRAEGSVLIEGGKVRVINDYDLMVVLGEPDKFRYAVLCRKYRPRLATLARELSAELGVAQIDIATVHLSYFNGCQPARIANYEVKNGHRLLYGAEDPCAWMPDYRAEDISLFEGTWLFRNRGGGMLLAGRSLLGNDRLPAGEEERVIIECNQAIRAMGDSILLMKGKYHFSYAKRMEIIQGLDLHDIAPAEVIVPLYVQALEQKLRPDFSVYRNMDFRKWWFDVKRLFGEFFLYFEERRLGLRIRDWADYAGIAKAEDRLEFRSLLAHLAGKGTLSIRGGVLKARRGRLIALMALLLFAVREDRILEALLGRAAFMFGRRPSGDPLKDWLCLTEAFLRLWHP